MRNRTTISFIFQFANLILPFTAVENILFPTNFGTYAAQDLSRTEELLDKAGLADKRQASPGQLSGGQQRRVAIARAFINNPAIILTDEPTGDLDEDNEAETLQLLYDSNREGTTFVVVTHNRELVRGREMRG